VIFFGGSPPDTLPDVIFSGSGYGTSCLHPAVGDVNADGCDDFSLGAPSANGRFVYFGGVPTVDTLPDVPLVDEYGLPGIGGSYAIFHNDFNGDGIQDIIAQAMISYGRLGAYLYLGSRWFNGVPDALINFGDSDSNWGWEISTGDVDGDGHDEFLVSAPYIWFDQGRAYLYDGPATWIDYGLPAVGPEELQRHPGWFRLEQNYPNPFNASTSIRFDLGEPSAVDLAVYDLKAEKSAICWSEKHSPRAPTTSPGTEKTTPDSPPPPASICW
jgi:hypothetical protein